MKQLLGYFFILISFRGYTQPVSILHKPYAEQYYFIDSGMRKYSPDIAIAKIAGLIKWAKANNDQQLADQLRLSQLRYDFYINRGIVKRQELIDIIAKAHAQKDGYLEANALFLSGEYWTQENRNAMAFENYLESYNMYSKFTAEEFPPKKYYLYCIAGAYMKNGDSKNAIRLFKEARNIKGDINLVNPINNSIGVYYRNLGNYDSAGKYFRQIYDDAISRNDTQWVGLSLGNIGMCYYYQKKYDKAIPLIEKDFELAIQTHQLQSAIGSLTYLADIYRTQHNNKKAEELLKKALAIAHSKPFWPKYTLAAPIFGMLARISFEKNDTRSAYLYLDSAMVARDSVASQFNELNIVKAQGKLELVQYQMEKQVLNNEKRVQRLIRNWLIAGTLLLLLTGIFFINGLSQKKKKLEAEKKNAEAELEMAILQLNGFRQNVQEKNNIIEQVTGEIARMKEGALQEIDNETILQLERSIILTDDQWEDFRVLFEKVHKGFFKRVKDKMPDLTPAELRFVALSKLKLNPKEMASILGISSNSIRNYRHRLRKKLNLDEDASIEEIADAI